MPNPAGTSTTATNNSCSDDHSCRRAPSRPHLDVASEHHLNKDRACCRGPGLPVGSSMGVDAEWQLSGELSICSGSAYEATCVSSTGSWKRCCSASPLVWAEQGLWLSIVGSDLVCCLVLFLAQVLKGQDLSVSSYCIHDRTKHNTECGNATQSLLSSSLVKGLKNAAGWNGSAFHVPSLASLACLSSIHLLWSSQLLQMASFLSHFYFIGAAWYRYAG